MAAIASTGRGLRERIVRSVPDDAAGFARLTLLLVWAMYLNVASGAFVRLTSSGLGCPDWPLCHGRPVPPATYHSVIEFSNRLVAFIGIAAALLAYIVGRRLADRTTRRFVLAVAVGTLFQIPLGAITVLFDLNPLLVISHFLLALSVLGCSTVAWVRATQAVEGAGAAAGRPRWLPGLAMLTAAACFALIVSGTASTAAGPHSGGLDIRRMGNLVDATYVHVRVAAAFIALAAVFVTVLSYGSWRPPGARRLIVALLVLIPAQSFVGEWQWRHHLPWGWVLAHVAIAAGVWVATVALATRVVTAVNDARPPEGGLAVERLDGAITPSTRSRGSAARTGRSA